LLNADPRDVAGLEALRTELAAAIATEGDIGNRFAALRLLGDLLIALQDYDDALEALQAAYFIARAFYYREAPWALEALARLAELVGRMHLAIGTHEHRVRAVELFQEALSVRQELRRDLDRLTNDGVTANLDLQFELARFETYRRDYASAEHSFLDLLRRPELHARPMLHASIEKQLGTNYRHAGRLQEAAVHVSRALDLYEQVARGAEAREDPTLMIEALLNIAYCMRHTNREAEAIVWFTKALEYARRRRDRRRIGYACLQLARSPLLSTKDVLQACTYLHVAERIFEKTGMRADLESARWLWRSLTASLSLEQLRTVEASGKEEEFASFYV
jgi:tetratricopeptide (TPR) repeat protein